MKPLTNKRALVTGCASGIGRAVAAALSQAGAAVVGLDLDASSDAPCRTIVTDISDAASAQLAVAEAANWLGGIDIVCNAAGILREARLENLDISEFDVQMAVNVRGTILVTQAALTHFADGGRIINIASELAYLGRSGLSAYCATKGAILSLTRSWARELAPRILVNAVAPGPVDTPLLGFTHLSARARATETANPLGRIARPDEIAPAVIFLAGPGASFITGQCIGIDGGAAMR